MATAPVKTKLLTLLSTLAAAVARSRTGPQDNEMQMDYLRKRFRFEYGTVENKEQYRDNWERTFGTKEPEPQIQLNLEPPTCRRCFGDGYPECRCDVE